MPKTEYWYPTAFSHWERPEHEAIRRVIESERFTMGPEVEAFEDVFSAYHGRRFGIMVNSGSSANLISIAAMFATGRIKEQPSYPDDVVVPAIAWSTTYAPIVQHGLNMRVIDVDDTWNVPVKNWPPNLNEKLIIACSILGTPGHLENWEAVAADRNIYLIEDNCESLGAEVVGGRKTGTFGIASTFSFFYSHQISAIEGGMVLTDEPDFAAACRVLRAHGWTRDVEPPKKFSDEYNFTLMGYNVRPLEMHAAIAREQLKRLAEMNKARWLNWKCFVDGVAGLVRLPKPVNVKDVRTPFGLAFLCENPEQRSKLVERLRQSSIDCRLPTGGCFTEHVYGEPWKGWLPVPKAEEIHRCGLFLGNAPFDITEKIDKAVAIMKAVL